MEHRHPFGVSRSEQSIFERLTALLGSDVFFVPCEWGTKKPLVTYVEQEVNVAVYLGKASGGLCTKSQRVLKASITLP
jgi:hypothetical protein